MPLIVHRTYHTIHLLLYIRYIENFKDHKEDIFILTFGTNVPGGVGNVVKTKVGRRVNVSNQLGALWLVVSNVLVIKNIGIVQKHPS